MVAVLLPLYFNPYAHLPIDAVKVLLFQVITLGMLIITMLSYIQERIDKDDLKFNIGNVRSLFSNAVAGNPLLIPSITFVLVNLLSTYFSIDPNTSFWGLETSQGTFTILSIVIFFLLIVGGIRNKEQVDRLITSLIMGSIPIAIYGWVQFLGFDPLNWVTGSISKVHSTLGYSLTLGTYLAMIIPFTLSRLILQQGKTKNRSWAYLIILLLQISCLFFTLARGAWLGLLIGCLVFLLILAYRWHKKRLFIISSVVLLAGSFIFLILNIGWRGPRMSSANLPTDTDIIEARSISNNERLNLWGYTLPIIGDYPLLGYGPETFSIAFWTHYPFESNQGLGVLNPWDAHNIILNYLVSIGILGMLAFLWIIFMFYRFTFRSLQLFQAKSDQVASAAIIGGVSAFLVQVQFNPIAFVPLVFFWYLLGLGVIVVRDYG